MTYPTLLALDFGTQRIGVAISRGSLAEPVTIIENTSEALREIAKLVTDNQVEKIVVGLSEGEMAEKSKAFAKDVKAFCHVPVVFTDETLTSFTVHEKLHESGKHIKHIDHFAAAEILQNYLDTFST